MVKEATHWGVIYCPKEGSRKTRKRWENIKRYLETRNVSFDYIQSEGYGSVVRLAAMMVANGYRTIVIVGGDAALNDALNGIMQQGWNALADVTLGIIPNGLGNDFARFWGFDEKNYKQTIDWLLQRRVRLVDVGVCKYVCEEKRGVSYFLDCVNVGLVASIMSIRRKTRSFWGVAMLSYLSSAFLLLFQRMEYKMRISVNEDELQKKIMTVCVGSAHGYGQTPNAVPYNGLLDVSIVSHPELRQLIEGLWLLFSGRFLNYKNVKSYRTRAVRFGALGKAKVSLDGRVMRDQVDSIEISIQQEKLNLIIPSFP